MKTATRLGAKPTARPVTFDEKLTLANLAMDGPLDEASAHFAIRTARIDIPEILAAPLPGAAPGKTPTTVDGVYQEAARLIRAHGWIRGYVGHPGVGYCLIGAIRTAAGGEGRLADQACDAIWDRIRREAPDALSPGAWNDAQHGPEPVIRMLGD